MSRALLVRAFALAALAGVLVLRSDSRGEGPSNETKAPAEATAKPAADAGSKPSDPPFGRTTVHEALAATADFNFTDTPLSDVASFVAKHFKINVILDTKALTDAGVTPETPITARATGIPLRSALHLALSGKDLEAIENDDNLLKITTADVAKSRTSTQIYDVRNFADPVVEFSSGPTTWTRFAEIVTSTVAPSSWSSNGGAGSVAFIDGNMVVSQTDEIHEQIADLLRVLETARQRAAKSSDAEIPVTIESPDSPESRIERALDSRQDFIFTDIRLGDVVQMLSKMLGVTVELDTRALTDAGITPDTPFSLKLKQVRAWDGLRELLSTKDLGFVIDHDVLLITTFDVGKAKNVTKFYPVQDLVGTINPATGEIDYQTLVDTITGTVTPTSWDSNGGGGSIEPFQICKLLVVSQMQDVHREIKGLLTRLRSERKKNPPIVVAPSNEPVVRMYSLRLLSDEKESQQIVDMIRKLIEPKSWNDSKSYIGVVSGSIVVRQTPEVHRHIQNLLNALGLTPGASTPATPTAAPTGSTGILGGSGGAF
jgi:hypothetical protein